MVIEGTVLQGGDYFPFLKVDTKGGFQNDQWVITVKKDLIS